MPDPLLAHVDRRKRHRPRLIPGVNIEGAAMCVECSTAVEAVGRDLARFPVRWEGKRLEIEVDGS